jgi:uncharacterized protein (DUF885 family)
MRTPITAAVALAALAALHAGDVTAAADPTIALADEMVAALKRRSPEIGTFLGLPDADHAGITDNSLEARARLRDEEDRWMARLAAIDARVLAGRPEWTIHGFLREALESAVATRVCEEELWSVDQMGGWQTRYSRLAAIQPIETAVQRQQALARYGALPVFVDREIANLRAGLQAGYTAPRINVEKVIAQMQGFAADSSPYFAPAERTTTADFAAAWRDMVRTTLVPAFRRYEAFLRDDYLPRARETVAVAALPNGAACYRARLREMTTVDVTAEQVHQTGLDELERIKQAQRAIAQASFETTELDRAYAALERRENLWTTREEVIARAREAASRAAAAMPRWFGRLPKTAVIITPVPAVEEPTTADRYQPGTIDGTRPGEYQINAGRWLGQPKTDLEAVVFHETIPGHHLENTLDLERSEAHLITKLVSTTAFGEGWGLYAERLADEMKLYSSDLDRFGMWQSRAYRAARLVVDTGLHAFGWPRERAIAFMKALHLAKDEEIASEVDRYIIWPGQATAYMIGALEIERLRADAERRLGRRFDIRSFHDRVLADGGVPLPMLREKLGR